MNLTRLESKTRVFILENLYPSSLVEVPKNIGSKTFGFEENFWSERNFGSTKNFGPQNILGQKKIGSVKKLLV